MGSRLSTAWPARGRPRLPRLLSMPASVSIRRRANNQHRRGPQVFNDPTKAWSLRPVDPIAAAELAAIDPSFTYVYPPDKMQRWCLFKNGAFHIQLRGPHN